MTKRNQNGLVRERISNFQSRIPIPIHNEQSLQVLQASQCPPMIVNREKHSKTSYTTFHLAICTLIALLLLGIQYQDNLVDIYCRKFTRIHSIFGSSACIKMTFIDTIMFYASLLY